MGSCVLSEMSPSKFTRLNEQSHINGNSILATRYHGLSLVRTQSDVQRVSVITRVDCFFFFFFFFFFNERGLIFQNSGWESSQVKKRNKSSGFSVHTL